MGTTKYPILDEDFTLKMLGACHGDEEALGLVTVLTITGMHISSVCALSPDSLIRQGSDHYLTWVRPKNRKTLQALVPKQDVQVVRTFLGLKRKSRQHYREMLRSIGEDAGYSGVSPNTFRHNLCVGMILDGEPIWTIHHALGCTPDVVARNYSKLKEHQRQQAKERHRQQP